MKYAMEKERLIPEYFFFGESDYNLANKQR